MKISLKLADQECAKRVRGADSKLRMAEAAENGLSSPSYQQPPAPQGWGQQLSCHHPQSLCATSIFQGLSFSK